MLDCGLWAPHGVEHYKIAALHTKYEQNPMITADIDTEAYIYINIRLSIYLGKEKMYESTKTYP